MKKIIEFQPAPEIDLITPVINPNASPFEDVILKDEYKTYKHTFINGTTKCRLLPPLRGSKQWMLCFKARTYPGGRHAAPRVASGQDSIFDQAYRYIKNTRPELLYSKQNKSGYRLLTSPLAACWVLLAKDGKIVPRIVLLSQYDGSRGGTSGSGHQLQNLIRNAGSHADQPGHPLNAGDGVSICFDRIRTTERNIPAYRVNLSTDSRPLGPMLDGMCPSDIDVLCPLEQTIRLLGREEEMEILGKVIGERLVDEVLSASARTNA